MKIISIGDLVTDYYYKNDKLVGLCGGMTSHNIIANISKYGYDTSVFGVCGNDKAGELAIKSLKDINVNTDEIKVLDDISTRCFHVSYYDENDKLEFKSKKRCPYCNEKRWYDESMIDTEDILSKVKEEDVLVFDNLNNKNQIIIDKSINRKVLDLGQYFELDNYSEEEITHKLKNKFDIINLNERVEKYLKNRFSLSSLEEIYNLIKPKMIIVTRGKNGSDFVVDGKLINKELKNPSKELDPTGAGDAFFSVFISEYVKNNYMIDENFIDRTFDKATKLTKKVVIRFGARGHIQNLYKIKKIEEECTCNNFDIKERKKIKRCNININNLETRIINALNSGAYDKLKNIDFINENNIVFMGTGGSLAGANLSSKIINNLYGINTMTLLPRDLYYRNNDKVDLVFMFSYSGTTNDLLVAASKIDNNKKYIITKGELQKIVIKTGIVKNNVISYRTGTNKGKEKGFLSFEGALAPSSLFLKLYFEINENKDVLNFIKDSLNYWKSYFDKYFKENKVFLKEFLERGSCLNIFTGDYTESAGIDLESKIIESGIYNCLVHEKKNFSHGRFINYENLNNSKNIYFKQKNTTLYEDKLLEYLLNGKTMIIESRYNGILCEYDLLVASQYLIYYISNYLNIDISKPEYTDEAMKIYFYKGEL